MPLPPSPARARNRSAGILFLAATAITILAGRWAEGLFTVSEFVHFSVNFPTVQGKETAARERIGGPWAMIPESEWRGYPAGGILAWGREGEIRVDMGKQAWIKRLVQPRDLTLSTHWLRNVGTRPYRIQLEIDMCGLPLAWETFERHWNPQTHSALRMLEPGQLFNMDWHLTIPPERFHQPLICAGSLRVRDAENQELLTLLPITIVNSRPGKDIHQVP
jgi:hypothetical protein